MGKVNYTWLVGFAAGMGGFLFGYEIGVIGQVLGMISFKTSFGLPVEISSEDMELAAEQKTQLATFDTLMTCTFLAGCVVSAGAFSMISDMIGRKYSIISSGLIFAVGGLFQALAINFPMMVVGRVVSGIAVGAASMVVPMYIAETAPAASRGALTTIYQLMITFGIFVATIINSIIITGYNDQNTELEWRVALGTQAVPAVLLIMAVLFIPFSPRWLTEKRRYREGQQAISRLRGLDFNDSEVIKEFGDIRESIEYEQSVGTASWGELFLHGNPRRILLGVVNQVFQQFTGVNLILYYCASIYSGMGVDKTSQLIAFPLANAFVNFVSTFPGMWAVDKYGRKPLLVYGGAAMAVAHCLVGGFLILAKDDSLKNLYFGAIISIYLFFLAFASTWGPVVWTYQSEIFPLRIRAKATGIATMTNWACNLITALIFPYLMAAIGNNVYFVFSGFCAAMCAWAYLMVPETKGLTLEQIDEVFGIYRADKQMSPTELELAKKHMQGVQRAH